MLDLRRPERLPRPIVVLLFLNVFVGTNLLLYAHDLFSDNFWLVNTPVHHLDIAIIESWRHIEVVEPSRHDPNDTTWPYRVFKTEQTLTPPNISSSGNGRSLSGGYLFLNAKNRTKEIPGQKQRAPFIIDTDNDLVYGFLETDNSTNNFQVQRLNGQSYLTLWSGETTVGHGYGSVILLDSTYRQTNVSLDVGLNIRLWGREGVVPPGEADFHEQTVTSRGTVLVTAYNNTQHDLKAIGGEVDSWVSDSMIFEIDIATGNVVFQWSAVQHIPISQSKMPLVSYQGDGTSVEKPWDHIHINSIQDLPEGLLISGRHTWSLYLISRETGDILWTLDGSGSRLGSWDRMPEDGQFSWQHHARVLQRTTSSMLVSLFDNHAWKEEIGHHPSRGLIIEVPMPPDKKKPPKVISDIQAVSRPAIYSDSQGTFQAALPNGNMLLGYGPVPVIQEFGPGTTGVDLRWQGRFGNDNEAMSYRVFKQEWHATPHWDPKLVMEVLPESLQEHNTTNDTKRARAYVSWNGATDIDEWNICFRKEHEEELIGKAARKGFETVFDLTMPLTPTCVRTAAVRKGKQIRWSNSVCF